MEDKIRKIPKINDSKGTCQNGPKRTCCIEGELDRVEPRSVAAWRDRIRYARCRRLLRTLALDAGGCSLLSAWHLLFDGERWGGAQVWLPVEGEPALLLHKEWNAHNWNPLASHSFPSSHGNQSSLCAGCGSPLSSAIAVDKNGFNWSMAEMLCRMEGVRFTSCDAVLCSGPSRKIRVGARKLRRCGALHAKVLDEMPGTHTPRHE